MPEPVATTTTPEGTTPTTTTTTPEAFDVGKYVNSDGTFKENFKEGLVPEELRGNKFYDIFTDIKGVFKAAGNQAVTLGKYGTTKGILPINERSTPQEVEAYRAAVGIPKDGSGYDYKAPEGVNLSPEMTKAAFDAFHKANYTPAQVNEAMRLYVDNVKQAQEAYGKQLEKQVEQAEAVVRERWGDKYDERLELSKSFITKMASFMQPEQYDALFGKETKVQDANGITTTIREGGLNSAEMSPIRPLLLDLFAQIEEKYGIEGSALESETTGTPGKSLKEQVADADREVYENVKLTQSLDTRDRDKYAELVRKRDLLYKRLYP